VPGMKDTDKHHVVSEIGEFFFSERFPKFRENHLCGWMVWGRCKTVRKRDVWFRRGRFDDVYKGPGLDKSV
jgi:hypothetical protein